MHGAEKIRWRIRSGKKSLRRVKSVYGIVDTNHARRGVGADSAVYAAKAIKGHTAVDSWDHICAICVFGAACGIGRLGICHDVGAGRANGAYPILRLRNIGRRDPDPWHGVCGGPIHAPKLCRRNHI